MARLDDVLTWLDGTPFQAEKVVGKGAMGVVLAAKHRTLGRSVCVKVLRPEASQHPGLIDRFRLEAQALAKLGGGTHKNLLHVNDFGETPEGRWFLVMERLYGRTLDEERRARGLIPWGEACQLVLQALAGLAVAHAAGLVHRDIKPANLFVCDPEIPDGPRVVKVLDFGVAKLLELASLASEVERPHVPTAAGVAIGTPRYMAPEQLAARPLDARCDVYAMALVLYALLSGRPPHEGLDGEALYAAQLREPLDPLPDSVPKPIADLVERASAKLREERPVDAADFARALEEAVKPAPSPGTGIAPRGTGPRGTQRVLQSPAPLPVIAAPMPSEDLLRGTSSFAAARRLSSDPASIAKPSDEGTTSRLPATEHADSPAEEATLERAAHSAPQGPSRLTFALVVFAVTVVLTAIFGLLISYLRDP